MSDHEQGLPAFSGDDDAPTPEPADEEGPPTPEHVDDVPPGSTRIMSSLIDAATVAVVFLVFSGVLTGAIKPADGNKYTSAQLRTLLYWSVVFAVVMALIFALLQSRGVRTLGKRVTHIHLVGPGGAPASFPRLLLKYISIFMIFAVLGYLGLVILLIGMVSAGLQRQRRNVFDQLSGLRPVLERREPSY